jgi:signal transduction histidine kinase
MPHSQSPSSWLKTSRHLLAGFLIVTLGPASGLVWLGWKLLDQERDLASQRLQERRERAADLAVSSLQQRLLAAESALLGAKPEPPGEDAVAVEFHGRSLTVVPPNRLPFYPVASVLPEPPSGPFLDAERLEFQNQDSESAIEAAAPLTRARDVRIRAGAHLLVARNLRKAGRPEAALAEYGELARSAGVAIRGVPAELVGRRARCALLAELGRRDELRTEAASLYDDLSSGRWQIQQAVYDVHAEELAGWLDLDRAAGAADYALAQGVRWLWERWQRDRTKTGRASETWQGRRVTMLWRGNEARLSALVAGPDYAERHWLSTLETALQSNSVEVALGNDVSSPGMPVVIRQASDTGLPWAIVVTSSDPHADLEELAGRRRLLFAGLALLVVLIGAGVYFIARAFAREMAVAQLQSDFVAAVSHDFRTPLTSLRQLSEAFNGARPIEDARRRQYYQVLERATQRLNTLVEGLLDFGRMEAGARIYRMESLEAADLVSSVVEDFRREAELRGYQVELRHDGDLPGINGDREALGRAIRNLLDNAIKYSPECKTVWVDLKHRDGRVAIGVRDRGLGISSAEQKEVLRKFVRGSSSERAGVKGTGIGLTMVQHIVRAHRGELRVESVPGEGSTFTILIPAAEK